MHQGDDPNAPRERQQGTGQSRQPQQPPQQGQQGQQGGQQGQQGPQGPQGKQGQQGTQPPQQSQGGQQMGGQQHQGGQPMGGQQSGGQGQPPGGQQRGQPQTGQGMHSQSQGQPPGQQMGGGGGQGMGRQSQGQQPQGGQQMGGSQFGTQQPTGSMGGQGGQSGGMQGSQRPIQPRGQRQQAEQGGALQPLTVNEVMSTDVVTCEPDTPIPTVVSMMSEENVGMVVVLEDDQPVDVITDRAIALAIEENPEIAEATAEDFQSEGLTTGSTDMTVVEALQQMSDEDIRRLPIVDDDGNLEGVLSLDDVLIVFGQGLGDVADIIADQVKR